MLQFKHTGNPPSMEYVRDLFKLEPDEIDANFGVISTDPANSLYTVLVATSAVARIETVLRSRPQDPAEGIFGNVRVEPFGPPQA